MPTVGLKISPKYPALLNNVLSLSDTQWLIWKEAFGSIPSFLRGEEVKGLDVTYPESSTLQRRSWEPTVLMLFLLFLLSSFFPPLAVLLLSFPSLPPILPGMSDKHYTTEDVILHCKSFWSYFRQDVVSWVTKGTVNEDPSGMNGMCEFPPQVKKHGSQANQHPASQFPEYPLRVPGACPPCIPNQSLPHEMPGRWGLPLSIPSCPVSA